MIKQVLTVLIPPKCFQYASFNPSLPRKHVSQHQQESKAYHCKIPCYAEQNHPNKNSKPLEDYKKFDFHLKIYLRSGFIYLE